MLVTKMALATSIALATLVASEAASAQSAREGHDAHQAAPTAYDAEANPDYKFGPRVTVKPGDVISGDSVIGRDPDPSIRDELLREYDSGRPIDRAALQRSPAIAPGFVRRVGHS